MSLPHAARDRAPPPAVELVVVRLPDAVRGAVGAVRRALRDREGRAAATGDTVLTDRGDADRAPLIVDALGWRRVLGPGANVQPPEARISRGLEVHPEGGGVDLDVWIDRSLVREGLRLVGARRRRAARRRRLLRAARPRQGADARDRRPARRRRPSATRATGSRTSCAPPPRTACSSSATRPATASRSRARGSAPPSTSASPAAASCAPCSPASSTREEALAALRRVLAPPRAAPSRWALRLQRLIPALPPRLLAAPARAGRPPPASATARSAGTCARPIPPSRGAARLHLESAPTWSPLTPAPSPGTSAASCPASCRTGARARC